MKAIKRIFILSGTVLLLAALSLCIYNIMQDRTANKRSHEVLSELKQLIPETSAENNTVSTANPADDIYAPYEQYALSADIQPEPLALNGQEYCGVISLPTLGIELPVCDSCTYDDLNISPCRFSGSASGNDLIIAAHNFSSHFGHIGELNTGDEIIFTDTLGTIHNYYVEEIRAIDGSDPEGMISGKNIDWDITLFTCNLSGQARIAVRGCKSDKK